MRILFLTHRLPYAPNRGDRVRAYHMLRLLARSGDVHLVSLVHDNDEASHVNEVGSVASDVSVVRVPRTRNVVRSLWALPTSRPTTHTMLDAPDLASTVRNVVAQHPPDVVLAYCTGLAHIALEPPLGAIPLVLDVVDVDSAKWSALAAVTRPPRSWVYAREARMLARFEATAARHAFASLVVTQKERETLEAIAPDARVEVISNGVDAAGLRPPNNPTDLPNVVFCGVMNYAPNEEAAVWLARKVWPLVRLRRPDACLQIVGSFPTRSVQRLANADVGITVTGEVPDVRPYLWQSAVSVAPLLTARGIQNKVLEAVAAGLPTVVTPIVAAGLPQAVLPACVVADGPKAFADAIAMLIGLSPSERRGHALRADLASVSWDRCLEPLNSILHAAAQLKRRDR